MNSDKRKFYIFSDDPSELKRLVNNHFQDRFELEPLTHFAGVKYANERNKELYNFLSKNKRRRPILAVDCMNYEDNKNAILSIIHIAMIKKYAKTIFYYFSQDQDRIKYARNKIEEWIKNSTQSNSALHIITDKQIFLDCIGCIECYYEIEEDTIIPYNVADISRTVSNNYSMS